MDRRCKIRGRQCCYGSYFFHFHAPYLNHNVASANWLCIDCVAHHCADCITCRAVYQTWTGHYHSSNCQQYYFTDHNVYLSYVKHKNSTLSLYEKVEFSDFNIFYASSTSFFVSFNPMHIGISISINSIPMTPTIIP